jgi:hypothetical protein
VDAVTPDDAPRTAPAAPHDQPLSQKTQGYFSLSCIALGMILFAVFGPNDIWTSLLVGAVAGGVAARPLLNLFLQVRSWIGALRR